MHKKLYCSAESSVLMHKNATFRLWEALGQLWKPLAELRKTLGEPLGGFGSTPKMQSCDKNNFILKI